MADFLLVLTVRRGLATPRTLELRSGEQRDPMGFGSGGEWQVRGPAIDPVHGYLYFDGQQLFVQSASLERPVSIEGVPVGQDWQAVEHAASIEFGTARVSVERQHAPPRPAQPASPQRAEPASPNPAFAKVEPTRVSPVLEPAHGSAVRPSQHLQTALSPGVEPKPAHPMFPAGAPSPARRGVSREEASPDSVAFALAGVGPDSNDDEAQEATRVAVSLGSAPQLAEADGDDENEVTRFAMVGEPSRRPDLSFDHDDDDEATRMGVPISPTGAVKPPSFDDDEEATRMGVPLASASVSAVSLPRPRTPPPRHEHLDEVTRMADPRLSGAHASLPQPPAPDQLPTHVLGHEPAHVPVQEPARAPVQEPSAPRINPMPGFGAGPEPGEETRFGPVDTTARRVPGFGGAPPLGSTGPHAPLGPSPAGATLGAPIDLGAGAAPQGGLPGQGFPQPSGAFQAPPHATNPDPRLSAPTAAVRGYMPPPPPVPMPVEPAAAKKAQGPSALARAVAAFRQSFREANPVRKAIILLMPFSIISGILYVFGPELPKFTGPTVTGVAVEAPAEAPEAPTAPQVERPTAPSSFPIDPTVPPVITLPPVAPPSTAATASPKKNKKEPPPKTKARQAIDAYHAGQLETALKLYRELHAELPDDANYLRVIDILEEKLRIRALSPTVSPGSGP